MKKKEQEGRVGEGKIRNGSERGFWGKKRIGRRDEEGEGRVGGKGGGKGGGGISGEV